MVCRSVKGFTPDQLNRKRYMLAVPESCSCCYRMYSTAARECLRLQLACLACLPALAASSCCLSVGYRGFSQCFAPCIHVFDATVCPCLNPRISFHSPITVLLHSPLPSTTPQFNLICPIFQTLTLPPHSINIPSLPTSLPTSLPYFTFTPFLPLP